MSDAKQALAPDEGQEADTPNRKKANRQEKKAKARMNANTEAKEKGMNFVQELALTMPVPDLEREIEDEIGEQTPIADAFSEWLKAVSFWQDEVEQRLARLEGKIDALCQMTASH